MSYSNQGAAALAEMSPYGRPPAAYNTNTKNSGWRAPVYPMVGANAEHGNKSSGWGAPTYPLVFGFDPGSFISENKTILAAVAAAVVVGGAAYYMGYR